MPVIASVIEHVVDTVLIWRTKEAQELATQPGALTYTEVCRWRLAGSKAPN